MRYALLSIKPRWVNLILKGKKTWEFRRAVWKKNVDYVFIYSSSPVQKVIGWFRPKVIRTDVESCCRLARRDIENASDLEIKAYFTGKDVCCAINIDMFTPLKDPIDLNEFEIDTPPMNFRYLRNWPPVIEFLDKVNGRVWGDRYENCQVVFHPSNPQNPIVLEEYMRERPRHNFYGIIFHKDGSTEMLFRKKEGSN